MVMIGCFSGVVMCGVGGTLGRMCLILSVDLLYLKIKFR